MLLLSVICCMLDSCTEISPASVCRDKTEGLGGLYPSLPSLQVLLLLSDVQTTQC